MSRLHPKKFDPLKKIFGWLPDRKDETLEFVKTLNYPTYGDLPWKARRKLEEKDVFLWQAKNVAEPNWHRGQQGIGDCVSWGAELACTMLLWQQHVLGELQFEAEAATETIYSGCRVEVHGRPQMGMNEDGAIGSWAIDWLLKWGVLLRLDYSKETGNQAHDLTEYSAKKAKDWGYNGCGGKGDTSLDDLAKLHPVKDATLVESVDDAVAALQRGCPLTTASMVGYGDMRRGSDGICNPSDEWAHQMMIGGLRWHNGEPNFRMFQSWDDMDCSGPDPGIDDDDVSDCSWWITPKALQAHLRDQDTFALSRVEGFDLPAYDLSTGLLV